MAPPYGGRSATNLSTRKSSFFNTPVAPPHPDVYYVGVDVGTGSARACIIDTNGIILGLAERPITRHELRPNYITQNSTEIWNAICFCVKACLRDSGVDPAEVYGIGFDATCSLVAISESTDEPLGVGPDFSNTTENIILWMDHRAEEETNAINATGDTCLKYVGGQMSIEMELPKIKWLKHHMPGGIKDVKFYDLPDFLTHKATGSEARSFNSAVCKQGFVPLGVENSETGWSRQFLESIDLPELIEDDFRRLGGTPAKSGTFLSAGDVVGKLTVKAAEELGLTTECIVGSAVIDAYAGWVGTVAGKVEVPHLQESAEKSEGSIATSCGRLAAVAGTSTCHIAMTRDPCFVQGVWGPYKDVMAPGYWLAEGGQSCTGALLAHVLAIHPALQELSHLAETSSVSKFDYLNLTLENLVSQNKVRSVVSLAKHIFFYGDFHGNRSPIADPKMRASIIGQSMDSSVNDLAVQYFAACEFIAQQTRQIVEEMEKGGHQISTIFMSGGQCRNGLLMRLLADCTGKPIVIPRYIDAAVVFGSAILGAVASEESVNEHIATKGRSRRSSILSTQKSQTSLNQQGHHSHPGEPHSPYTAPSATASTTNMSTLVYSHGNAGSHHQFGSMTPMQEENTDYFNQPTAGSKAVISEDEDTEDDEQTLSFGSKQNVQKGLSQKMHRLDLKPLSAIKKVTSKDSVQANSGDKLWRVMEKMTGPGKVIMPSDKSHPDRKLLNAKYAIFLEQCYKQQEYRRAVDLVESENLNALKLH
ncbi:Pentulose kinase [Suhomyces tanzawaensis NRRL Y-17324]|uniref:Pentulose kinase n=1 Tax=Suhomyces tanzawaensis NRRL Y-17324 TaxID=984487 RepID=A0A1E4SFY3_9ASCO|nr:Pentulose kinase [Suhomyces tanzawaensis NRRL Y-17324]ODV78375.1 Pentulose kinase [Suhomyces tanzawaensis NRRL Y-17324]